VVAWQEDGLLRVLLAEVAAQLHGLRAVVAPVYEVAKLHEQLIGWPPVRKQLAERVKTAVHIGNNREIHTCIS
jgi:hypothetical protein